MGTIFRIGDIGKTKYWLSVERRPFNIRRWFLSFKPTYFGTTAGICIIFPGFSILGHIRDLSKINPE